LKYLLSVLVVLVSFGVNAEAISDVDKHDIMESATNMANAYKNKNYDIIIDLMPQKTLDQMGGKDAALEFTKNAMENLASDGIEITHFEVIAPEEMIITDLNKIVLVPSKMMMTYGENELQTAGFLIAFKALDSNKWRFIDAAGVTTREEMEALFPSYPKDKAIPQTEIIY
jgi:hypothetical protein